MQATKHNPVAHQVAKRQRRAMCQLETFALNVAAAHVAVA
eukprot:COSAG01_NODE_36357_length_518_cov_521.747017_1_plen_39_part_01